MALFPLSLQVEESALGTVLRVLKGLPGIVKLDLNLDEVPSPKGSRVQRNGKDHEEKGPPAKTLIISALADVPAGLHLDQLAERTGVKRGSMNAALNDLRNNGITESAGPGQHKLTARALEEMGAKQHKPTLALPKPGAPLVPSAVIAARLALGEAERPALINVLIENNIPAAKIKSTIDSMRKTGVIERNPGKPTFWRLTGTAAVEPVVLKRGASKDVVLSYFKEHDGRAKRLDLTAVPGLTPRIVDGVLTRLKEKKIIESAGVGAFRFTKDAAKKLQAPASKE